MIHDRDPVFNAAFGEVFRAEEAAGYYHLAEDAGVERHLRARQWDHPPRALGRILIVGERHLALVFREYVAQSQRPQAAPLPAAAAPYFFWLLEPDELAERLAAEKRYYNEFSDMLRALAAAKDRGEWGTGPRPRAQRITVEAVLRLSQAMAEWAEWAAESNLMTAEGFGAVDGAQSAHD